MSKAEFAPTQAVLRWLLDADASIRWQVKRDLLDEPEESVAAERSLVAVEGWGARLLGLQQRDGNWGGGAWVRQSWASTMETLTLLRELGLDPTSAQSRKAIDRVCTGSNWGPYHGHAPFFEGESEPCINGRVLACGAYFGHASERLVDRLLSEQLSDGGWNCDAPPSTRSSFNSTLCVLEGLLEYEQANGGNNAVTQAAVTQARLRGQEYLLERKLFRSRSTGEAIVHDRKSHDDWREFSFPTRWHYDVLWALDYLRRAGARPDERLHEAIDLLVGKRNRGGRWPLDHQHAGAVHFVMEGKTGTASRWNTLRALRVLKWYSAQR